MKAFAALGLLIALGSCSNPIDDARAKLDIAQKSGDKVEICRRANALADAYMDAKDQDGYLQAHNEAQIYCLSEKLSS